METVLDFIMAALLWLSMGLMLAIFAVRENSRKNNPEKEDNYGSEGMALGMCFGTAIASATKQDIGLGISIGMLMGLAAGTSRKKK